MAELSPVKLDFLNIKLQNSLLSVNVRVLALKPCVDENKLSWCVVLGILGISVCSECFCGRK